MSQPDSGLTRNATLASLALLTSSATLVCCVLPAVLVMLGAGAALAGLVTAIPQLIWLSEHKPLVFGLSELAIVSSRPVRLKALGDHMLELAGVVRGVRGPYKVNKLCGSGGRI